MIPRVHPPGVEEPEIVLARSTEAVASRRKSVSLRGGRGSLWLDEAQRPRTWDGCLADRAVRRLALVLPGPSGRVDSLMKEPDSMQSWQGNRGERFAPNGGVATIV